MGTPRSAAICASDRVPRRASSSTVVRPRARATPVSRAQRTPHIRMARGEWTLGIPAHSQPDVGGTYAQPGNRLNGSSTPPQEILRKRGDNSRMTASTDSPARVLVVDDERSIVELVATALRYEGFQVETAATGREALRSVASWRPDLVVLDVMLPDLDGHEVHRRLDGSTPVPILYLTARDATEDKVRGLTLGADDYVTKPFSLEELVARVRSVLRRTRPDTATSGRLELHDLVLDEDTHEVTRAGRAIELTPTEFNLLRYLLVNARRVVSKSQILDHVWQYDFGGDTNIVETYISYLRRKVDHEGEALIHTVRGVGYTLRLPRP
jgi:two-component system OmpR family response regulator